MTDTRGTFRLKNVRQDILNSEYVPIPNVWIGENQSVGYTKMYGAAEYKFNFSTSTTTTSTIYNAIAANKYLQAGTSNPSYAWFVGGNPGPITTSIKITYATDTAADNPSSRISVAKHTMGAISGESHSYFVGGGPGGYSTVSKLTHSNDTTVDLPGSHLAAGKYMKSTGHGGGAHAYIFRGMPGSGPNNNTTTERITFANDTRTTLPSSSDMVTVSSKVPYWGAGNLQCSTHCYYAGGVSGGSTTESIFQKLTFSNETWGVNPSYMTQKIRYISGMTANSSKGYIAGGLGPGYKHDVDSVAFATDTWAGEPSMDLPSSIPGASQNVTYGGSEGTTLNDSLHPGPSGIPTIDTRWFDSSPTNMQGYFTGGNNQSWQTKSITQKLDYSSETTSTIPANMPTTYHTEQIGSTGNASKGILAGGLKSGVTKFTYSDETYTYLGNIPGSLDYRYQQGHTSTTAAYFSGGHWQWNGTGTHTYKMPYSSDVTAQVPGAALNEKRSMINGTGMSKHDSHGYVIGGVDPAGWPSGSPSDGYTNSEKITYASDTFAILPGMMTTSGSKYSTAAVGVPNLNGYWVQGIPSPAVAKSDCGKVNFSTDSMASLPNLPYNMIGKIQCAVGAGDRVYFAGGWRSWAPSGTTVISSVISKVECSTDTFTIIPGRLDTALDNMASLTQTENGFPIKSPDLASDGTSTAPTPTPQTYEALTPSLNANAVFAAGRGPSSPSPSNNRSKLTFSNDSMASMPSFTTNYNGYGNASSTTRGYLTGGWGTNSMGDTQNKRWYNQYSNDTSGQVPGTIPYNAGGFFSVNSETELYAGGGGWSSGQYSSVHKMAFANETNVGVPGMQLATPLKNAAGVGDKTVGYACGSNYYNNWRSYISKITYATETMATSPATLAITGSSPYYGATGTSSKTKGYIMAGNATDKLTFSTDTISTLGGHSSGLTSTWPGTSANSATAGYTMFASPSPHMIKFTFSTEGASTVTSVFSPARSKGGGMSQAMFGGAYSPAPYLI